MAFDSTFVADDAAVSAIASRQFTGTRHARFALVDLGPGLSDAPPALVWAYLKFRAIGPVGSPAARERPIRRVGTSKVDPDDRHARHLVVIELTGPGTATVVGCARINLRNEGDVPPPGATDSGPAAEWENSLRVEMSRFTVRHSERPVRQWIHAWLMSEVLAEAARHRLPWAFAIVAPEVLPGLAQAGVRFERWGGPQHRSRDSRIWIRINALASLRRLRHDYRVPKLAAARWTA